jgi:hypothetical protein
MGSPHQIAAAISKRHEREKLRAHLAIAPHPDTAILLARHSGKLIIADEHNEASICPMFRWRKLSSTPQIFPPM